MGFVKTKYLVRHMKAVATAVLLVKYSLTHCIFKEDFTYSLPEYSARHSAVNVFPVPGGP